VKRVDTWASRLLHECGSRSGNRLQNTTSSLHPELATFGALNWLTLALPGRSEFFRHSRRLTDMEVEELRRRYQPYLADLRAYCLAHPDPWGRPVTKEQIRAWAEARGIPIAPSGRGIDLSSLFDGLGETL
jgi:hypothetical protein